MVLMPAPEHGWLSLQLNGCGDAKNGSSWIKAGWRCKNWVMSPSYQRESRARESHQWKGNNVTTTTIIRVDVGDIALAVAILAHALLH
jgi:hypothetical protein